VPLSEIGHASAESDTQDLAAEQNLACSTDLMHIPWLPHRWTTPGVLRSVARSSLEASGAAYQHW